VRALLPRVPPDPRPWLEHSGRIEVIRKDLGVLLFRFDNLAPHPNPRRHQIMDGQVGQQASDVM